MFELIILGLAAGVPALTAVYWICLIVGGGLLAISTILGTDGHAGFDADVSVDADISVDADVHVDADMSADVDASGHFGGDTHAGHHHAGSLASWFSIQFVVFFMAMFGLIGVVLTHLTSASSGVGFGSALVGGLIVGQSVHQILRKLRRTSGDSTVRTEDYVNKLARVTIAIDPPHKGEVALLVRGGERFVPAVSRGQEGTFGVGEEVAVVDYTGGIAEVVSRKEFEFLSSEN